MGAAFNFPNPSLSCWSVAYQLIYFMHKLLISGSSIHYAVDCLYLGTIFIWKTASIRNVFLVESLKDFTIFQIDVKAWYDDFIVW